MSFTLIRWSSFGKGDAAFVRRPSAKIMPLHGENGLMLLWAASRLHHNNVC